MVDTMTEDWITAQQAAQRLGITRDTAYRLLQDGKIPGSYRVGGQWRVSIAALASFAPIPDDAARVVGSAKFKIGDKVDKVGGDYEVPGEVRAIYTTCACKLRYVVEIAPFGYQHIYKESQLRHASDRTSRTASQTA